MIHLRLGGMSRLHHDRRNRAMLGIHGSRVGSERRPTPGDDPEDRGMKIYIRLADAIGPTVARAFDDLTVRTETVLTGGVTDPPTRDPLAHRPR